jgi:hypothetical protein
MRRLDRVSSQINPYLLAVAIGLGVLYLTCLGALIVRLPTIHMRACEATAAVAAASETEPK